MIFQNLMIQWNPTFVLISALCTNPIGVRLFVDVPNKVVIDINKLILFYNS